MVSWGEKNKSLGKNEKGERKKEENYIKKWEKGLKNASFWAINSTNFAGESSDPPPLPSGGASPCPQQTYLSWEKIESQMRGVGNDQNAQYISLHLFYFSTRH